VTHWTHGASEVHVNTRIGAANGARDADLLVSADHTT
jgi:hypothetical protein